MVQGSRSVFVDFLSSLKSSPEGDSNLLDHTRVFIGSNLGSANGHVTTNLADGGYRRGQDLAARGESPASRCAAASGRDRGVEVTQYLNHTSESRQRRARPEDASDGRATFTTGC